MALQNTDLFVAYRTTESKQYAVKLSDLKSASLPDGTQEGQILQWDGSAWVASLEIDCGEYAT